MTKTQMLLAVFAKSARAGAGIHTAQELLSMLEADFALPAHQAQPSFNKLLADAARRGVIRRVAKGLYESVLTPPETHQAPYQVIRKLRGNDFTYLSLETELSRCGVIPYPITDRFTLMTTGRSGTFDTPYGRIEFVHTRKSTEYLKSVVFLDTHYGIYRATAHRALMDMIDCGRPLQYASLQ